MGRDIAEENKTGGTAKIGSFQGALKKRRGREISTKAGEHEEKASKWQRQKGTDVINQKVLPSGAGCAPKDFQS